VLGVLTTGDWDPLDPVLPEPLVPLVPLVPVPVDPPLEPPPSLLVDRDEALGVCLLARATTARFSLVGAVWAEAGTASGPLVTEVRPPATPANPPPKPIKAATTTGTANRAAPANPRATILRRHQASNPLPIRSFPCAVVYGMNRDPQKE
jgi:hypothetical protein